MKLEEILDPAKLPEDLQWLVTEFRLSPKDPVFHLIAWHHVRVKKAEDTLNRLTVELKAGVEKRIEALERTAESAAKLSETLTKVQSDLNAKPKAWSAQWEADFEKALGKARNLEETLGEVLRKAKEAWEAVRRREILAGMGVGFLLGGLAVFLFTSR